jgi:hypothetical protein
MQQEVERSFSFWGTTEGDAIHPAECMHQLLEQVRRHKVNIDGNVCTVMVTTLVLEVTLLTWFDLTEIYSKNTVLGMLTRHLAPVYLRNVQLR